MAKRKSSNSGEAHFSITQANLDNKGKTKQTKNVDTKSKQKNEVFTENNGDGNNRNEDIREVLSL